MNNKIFLSTLLGLILIPQISSAKISFPPQPEKEKPAYFKTERFKDIEESAPLYKACNADPYTYLDNPTLEGMKPAYYCGKLAANVIAFATGIISDLAVNKMNIFGTKTKLAKDGKNLLFSKVQSDADWFNLKKALTNYRKTSANDFYETMTRLEAGDIQTLTTKKQIYNRLLEESVYLDTFDGFVQNGAFSGRVKYRVDMNIAKYVKEFPKYSDPYNFNFQKLIDQGISKQGFFTVDELDQALNIYVAKGLGEQINVNGIMKDKGEIIFVKKTDGTTILTPRLNGDGNDFPHPVLVKGDDVLNAGTIKPIGSKYVEITNKTGHYKVHKDDMLPIVEELKAKNYIVEFKEGN